ncbi:hypothetical protein ADIARSV_2923 [Arcticibacter svalbardensis MN12-7]|uniref:Right handed beta helix domain-containing protein n=1 Tax=Arcticibacter svalbardensis MN12-7 TaxID=1150600 RepID=R9GQV0_9SPHI|nr:right-handed parallel beta-helix repeat-containing protein [Arcticibacter svalbardensis]EOR93930.1 hypothetical protein ADIARSV_2923 [Arcticibacter svalbardensis MN12-7]
MNQLSRFLLLSILFTSFKMQAVEYHVSKDGNDFTNKGTQSAPFKTISKAAQIAFAGDKVIVHKGVYREWVSPANGGLNNFTRITYQAADNEAVWIKGSEEIKKWVKYKGNVWKTVIDNVMFGNFNPYQIKLEGEWLLNTYGMDHHLGEVYLNDKALYETDSLYKVMLESPMERTGNPEASKYKWYCESNEEFTTIYANFKGLNPNKELVEINVRPAVFFPKNQGLNYITVRGFNMCHAATQWAPPTSEQLGLIGPNWSKGWIIENNLIYESKCSGISIGKERASGQDMWTKGKRKHGTQTEREVIFKALQLGWSKEMIGSHIIRNNTIRDCGQTGIVGHMGCAFSEISNNLIYNINTKRQFWGYETAGIKLHVGIDVLIKNNCIHDNNRGIWLDWEAQGARITGNVLYNNTDDEDLFIEVCHGPLIVDNNLLLSERSLLNASEGTAFAHNLIKGSIQMRGTTRFIAYHYPHSTQVMGVMGFPQGDDRYYNNIFAAEQDTFPKSTFSGLNAYNEYPDASYKWKFGKGAGYYDHKLPVFINANLYLNKALASKIDISPIENKNLKPEISIEQEGNNFYLNITSDETFTKQNCPLVTTEMLGASFQAESLYENADGSALTLDKDITGACRDANKAFVGPIEKLQVGKNRIKVWGK